MAIRAMRSDDWSDVAEIYAEGIADGDATFELTVPTWEEWDRRFLPSCRLVAIEQTLVAWAALSPVSSRACYRGVAEVSVYVRRAARRGGIGAALLRAVIDASEREGFWTLQGSTFPENEASLRLQESCGFRLVGRRERIGSMHGRWRDTIITERRSAIVGR